MSKSKKLYLLLRNDLGPKYNFVQGNHALAAYSLKGDLTLYREWNNGTLICLGVPDLADLEYW